MEERPTLFRLPLSILCTILSKWLTVDSLGVMTEPPAIDLLHLLYEDGDKMKPLSPLLDNPSGGAKIGPYLRKNSYKDISEWADMIFLLAKKKKSQHTHSNSRSRYYVCDDANCTSSLHIVGKQG